MEVGCLIWSISLVGCLATVQVATQHCALRIVRKELYLSAAVPSLWLVVFALVLLFSANLPR